MPAALAAITVLRPGAHGQERDFELHILAADERLPAAVAYIAVTSLPDLADVVVALAEIANAPRVD